mgnify:FL=1
MGLSTQASMLSRVAPTTETLISYARVPDRSVVIQGHLPLRVHIHLQIDAKSLVYVPVVRRSHSGGVVGSFRVRSSCFPMLRPGYTVVAHDLALRTGSWGVSLPHPLRAAPRVLVDEANMPAGATGARS